MLLTDAGERLHAQIRAATTRITQQLWGDLPVEDLAAAGRVLSTVLARANAELDAQTRPTGRAAVSLAGAPLAR